MIWHTERAIRELHPHICILENVKGMISSRNKPDFDAWCKVLEDFGYINFYKVLNSKDFQVPQNRERVFMVSILPTDGNPNPTYNFPFPMPLTTCVEDIMVPLSEVPEDAWIDPERVTQKVVRDILDQPNVYEELLWRYHVEEASRRLYGRSDFDFMMQHYDELAEYAEKTLGAANSDK